VSVAAPRGRVGDGLVQHPQRQRLDQLGLLGQGNEVPGRDHAQAGVLPAHQCLDRDDLVGRELQDRLVVQDELAVVDRDLEVAHQLLAPTALLLRGQLAVGQDARTAALGLVHGRVGMLGQGERVRAVLGIQRDAEAARDTDRHAAQVERLGDGAAQALGLFGDAVVVVRARGQDGELVPAQAGDQV
jgi:hypothetical protein